MFVLTILLYTGQKLEFLIYRKGVDIITNVVESHFDESYRFTAEEGFNIAIGFTAYNYETEWILPKEIGNFHIVRN